MANREIPKIKIDPERFLFVLKARGSSIRKLGMAYDEIQRTEKTIHRCLKKGEMPPDLLKRIARFLKVSPSYLAGVDDEPKSYLGLSENNIECFLTMNNISMLQFEMLDPVEKVTFEQELVLAMHEVIAKHFKVDRFGNDITKSLE